MNISTKGTLTVILMACSIHDENNELRSLVDLYISFAVLQYLIETDYKRDGTGPAAVSIIMNI